MNLYCCNLVGYLVRSLLVNFLKKIFGHFLIYFLFTLTVTRDIARQLLLLNMGFTSVYQLGRAGRGNGGWGKPITYTQKISNQI